MDDRHEFRPGGRHIAEIEEDNCCASCGEGEEHASHKDENGDPYYDTDTVIDRMRADGSVVPKAASGTKP